ncbi:GGDEF domain-containing protein [Rhodoferax saidenbachensis]|uniref:diguanylate cyclase n=2 Tax=Rhodoferax saidenbachensis TaxID=1484693 RepID=A0A1P8K8V9_9BURK|nr:GGDEF domain-containing protein [Rhodoferax saidenbachensis]
MEYGMEAEDFDILIRVASLVTGAPNAFITLVDPHQNRLCDESYCSAALKEDDILVIEDVRKDTRTSAIAARRQDAAIVTYAGALLKTEDGTKVGTLCVTDHVQRTLTEEQIRLLRGLAKQVMSLLSLRNTQRELTDALARMTRLATTDDLTGFLNRRAFFEEAENLRKLAVRQGGALSVVVVDLDHFKKVNDKHGHAAGDAVLKEVARRLRSKLRSTDRIGRIGGEEFAIALPFTSQDTAMELMRQLQLRVSRDPVAYGDIAIPVTFSAGISELGGDTPLDEALRLADKALYRSKAAGRNQITEAEPLAA